MGHPDEGLIRAFLDGEAGREEEGLRSHMDECAACSVVAQEQRRAMDTLRDALALLDVEPSGGRARERVLRTASERRRLAGRLRRSLPRAAAVIVFLAAGAAAAMPGSPVRQWALAGFRAAFGSQERSPSAPVASPDVAPEAPPAGPETVGATLRATSEGLELRVVGLRPGALLRVVLVEGDQAGIFAGEGTRFRTESRRMEAAGPPGDVKVEIPGGAADVILYVNDRVYLRKTEEVLEVPGPVLSRTTDEIIFAPSDSTSNAPRAGV